MLLTPPLPFRTTVRFCRRFKKGRKQLKAPVQQHTDTRLSDSSLLPGLGRGQPCKTALFSKILRAALTTACCPWLGFFLAVACPGTDGLFTEALESMASCTLGAITAFHSLDIHLWYKINPLTSETIIKTCDFIFRWHTRFCIFKKHPISERDWFYLR